MASVPGFFVELDQALEFAQDMGVAEGVVDRRWMAAANANTYLRNRKSTM
jgi:hypothetical protein